MTFWSGYTFSGMDGAFQSLPLILAQVVFPAPASFVKAYTLGVSVWTMYIHGGADLGWPFLGPDYHLIHHQHNWYNFGFFTVFWDTVFGTVKHPHPKWKQAREAKARAAKAT